MHASTSSSTYRMPAEWEPHLATWLCWPNFTGISFSDHQDHDHLEEVFVRIVRALIPGEEIWINTISSSESDRIRQFFGKDEQSRLKFFEIPTKEPWLRDFGGSFVISPEEQNPLALVDWQFNAWGGRYSAVELENAVPRAITEAIGIPLFETDFVIEGGSFEVNGSGLLLATESCVLNANRNAACDMGKAETILSSLLGVQQFIWLPGGLAWDDLDGHIDAAAQFAGETRVVVASESDLADVNFEPLARNRRLLSEWRDADGAELEIVEIPMPAPLNYLEFRLPASYVNFYIGNSTILMPAFGDPNDAAAAGCLQELFPDRQVVSIDCRQIIRDFGALHCLLLSVPLAGQPA